MSYLKSITKNEDGTYIDKKGLTWSDAASVMGNVFGFCGCGSPDEAMKYMRDVMRLVNLKRPEEIPWDDWYKTQRQKADDLFKGSPGAEYAAYYILNEKNLTEHGSSVPGWLTRKGEDVLVDLEEMFPITIPNKLETDNG